MTEQVFVARERELSQLQLFLDRALTPHGQVCFVTGEAGSGKTALVTEFARRAQAQHADLIVAIGDCNAQTGIGDPYLPFREILAQLTGDVETKLAQGAITQENAGRLRNFLGISGQVLVDLGPDLIDIIVPGIGVATRAGALLAGKVGWLGRFEELAGRNARQTGATALDQSRIFEQYANVLRALAAQQPLLLLLDDLQWADASSISLLFHLGRRIGDCPILILNAYRSEDVALGRGGDRHPLEPVLNEFKRYHGDIWVNLGRSEDVEARRFVDALIDCEPNVLRQDFRQTLFRHTGGHPLFTLELLRALQERRDLVQDEQGRWIEGPTIDLRTLPARVEGVIEERIGRLKEELREALTVASVEGEDFTAEVVAGVQDLDERGLVRRLSGELAQQHRLVGARGIRQLRARRLCLYSFRHSLFQRYLYNSLDEVERSFLHEEVGNVLEALYGDQTEEIAVQLARHFQEATVTAKAVHYLQQAGERAVQLCAYQEGISHLTRGLELLMAQPDSPERTEQELALQLALGIAWMGSTGAGAQAKTAFTRARDLCQQIGKTPQLCRVLGELSVIHYVRAEHHRARELAEEALRLAQRADDPMLVALHHSYLGAICFCRGEYTTALGHVEQVIAFYNPEQHHGPSVSLGGMDLGLTALAYAACCLWCLGYPDKALSRSQEALALVRELGHPFSLADVLCYAGCVFNAMRRDAHAFNNYAEELKRLASDKVPGWLGQATRQRGEALAMLGHLEDGIEQMQKGLALQQFVAEQCNRSGCLCSLAEAQGRSGQPEDGLSTLAEALALVEQTDERYAEAELYRVKGELLLARGDEVGAEVSLHKAIEVARRQSAKSWELRAVMTLCRLWQKHGKNAEAHQMLAEIYDWFSEGFDTLDLLEAKELLEELSS